ncbi:PAS domain S-box protein [Mesoterricola silvestris]|uniref:histidine kinase n=1 Tax=Mesoterricola silvestris TaxID=2927979 RepID=A0AA48KBE8_9BACT|nr:PAS domain S-box protein [Mesoterricola silvestris]BDU74257.1 hypothetical protein METEAL_34310 [Mesoterricola silvestris]
MTFGTKSMVLVAAFAASLVLILGGGLAAAFHLWRWTPFLAAGLVLNAAVAGFLWKGLGLMAARCAEGERERDGLRDQAALLRFALDGGEDGVRIVDAAGAERDRNPSYSRLWGLEGPSRDEEDIILAQLKDPDGYLAREAAPSGVDILDLWDGRVLERRSRPYRTGGGEALRVWQFRDITSRARADRFVNRLSQAVEQSPVSILITDTAGNIEFINTQFTELTGFALDEALGQTPRILKSGLTDPRTYAELWAAITAGDVWVGELQNRKKDGELFWERATISPMRDADGVITHFLGMKQDITRQKQLEQQLRHSQKLEAVGLLAGGVAHDFNNVLQVINGYGTLMQLGQGPDDPDRDALAEILKAAERAAQLTHSLLAFSRKQVMSPRTLDLNTVVGNVEKLLRRIIGADVRLEVARHPEALPVHVDLGQMEQVFMNLATNARDAMPAGGTLTLATRPFRLDEAFRAARGFGRPGDYALLEVKDSGEGMDEETQKRIFDPFFTTREMGRGTGLGLASVYGIVKQHKGYILVNSEPGAGSAFRVLVPISASDTPDPQERDRGESGVRGTETILVVEDELPVRAMTELVLARSGYRVLLAADGQEAVDVFRANRDAIDFILMDIIMPRKGGRQAYEEIRRERPGVKVLFISGYTADFIQDRGELDPGMDLIMKPVQPLALLGRIREILDRPPSPPGSADPSGSPAAPAAPAPSPASRA